MMADVESKTSPEFKHSKKVRKEIERLKRLLMNLKVIENTECRKTKKGFKCKHHVVFRR